MFSSSFLDWSVDPSSITIISYLKGRSISVLPDFISGGYIDVDHYNKGARGGKVRVRAEIDIKDKNTLVIKSVPHGVTTLSLIESIIKACPIDTSFILGIAFKKKARLSKFRS